MHKTLLVLVSILLFSSCHLVKSVIYLRPDHKDGNKFPKNEIEPGSVCLDFSYHETPFDIQSAQVTFKDGHTEHLDHVLGNNVTNAFIIIKDSKVLSEHYFNNYNEEDTHGSFSVAKGMTSSLLGLALHEGLIHSLEDPITHYIPELLENDSAFVKITIHHLLDMASGIKIRGKDASLFGDLAKTYYGNNWGRFMSTIEIDTLPGGTHRYNQTDPELLSLIIKRVTGTSLSLYFSEKIWSKLGTARAYWNTYGKDDLEKGFCCFNARPLDYAKFAQLYLQKGSWQGEQLIPAEWIDFVTTRDELVESPYVYSFHKYWFLANDGSADYTAQGYNGMMIYINPERNLSILRFAKKEEKEIIDWESVLREIASQIPE
ncbi:MAG: CubicO group peptidase (beta-lactamase class C family) [Chitinophagales bacterium]|jgi:CubicO group peptidase (beta-lactamase class C family)